MGHLPFAFSVHNFIKSVGSDAGFASIIGLALLVLLYFAHARETAVLRNHAEEAADRIQRLETQVAGLAQTQRQAAPAPAPAPAAAVPAAVAYPARPQAAPGPAPVRTAAPAPIGAPAGVGAPALTAATRLIPNAAALAPVPAATAGASPTEAYAAGPPPASPSAAPAGTNGTGEHTLPPQSAAGARAATREPRPTPRPVGARTAASTRPPVQIRPGASAARLGTAPARGGNVRSGPPSRARRVLPALLALVALGAAVALLLVLTSGSGGSTQVASSSTPASNAPSTQHPRSRPKAFNPATVTVTVLNGTATSGLAHRISTKLTAAGFKQGTVSGASDATRTATVVSYTPGHSQDALEVAKLLKLGSASVQRIDPSTQAIACPPPSQCAASVVVTVGADLSNQ
jgi:hypothetical protein